MRRAPATLALHALRSPVYGGHAPVHTSAFTHHSTMRETATRNNDNDNNCASKDAQCVVADCCVVGCAVVLLNTCCRRVVAERSPRCRCCCPPHGRDNMPDNTFRPRAHGLSGGERSSAS